LSGKSTKNGLGWCACMPVDIGGGTGRTSLRVGASTSLQTPNGCLVRRVSTGLPGGIRIAGPSGNAVGADGLLGRSVGRTDTTRISSGAQGVSGWRHPGMDWAGVGQVFGRTDATGGDASSGAGAACLRTPSGQGDTETDGLRNIVPPGMGFRETDGSSDRGSSGPVCECWTFGYGT